MIVVVVAATTAQTAATAARLAATTALTQIDHVRRCQGPAFARPGRGITGGPSFINSSQMSSGS
eukprot:5588872-Pyramimonas_sp.AAC.1